MTARRSSRPVRKRGRGKSVIERQLQLLATHPPGGGGLTAAQQIVDERISLPSCARCGLLICGCFDRQWKGGGDAR